MQVYFIPQIEALYLIVAPLIVIPLLLIIDTLNVNLWFSKIVGWSETPLDFWK